MQYINESYQTPCRGEYDIIVCGGGVAGVAAAVSAKRAGAGRVLLLEKSVLLGGLATIGLIAWYEPICDGNGKKLIYGMASELLQLTKKYGPSRYPSEWQNDPDSANTKKRYAGHYSPTFFSMALDHWVLDAGVELLFDTVVVQPVMQENVCHGVVVENKSGRGFYAAKVVIDTTGDLDIFHRAGAPTELGKNFLTYIGYRVDGSTLAGATQSGNFIDARKWFSYGSDLWGNGHPANMPQVSGTTAEEVTDFVLTGRKGLLQKCMEDAPLSRDISLLPSMPQFRKTRRLCGAYTLTEQDKSAHFADSIGCVCDFAHPGELYELPYRILYHPQYSNLFTAGRTVSSSGWAWDVTRVIPVAVLTGEAAGLAAADVCDNGCAAKEVCVATLQQKLQQRGIHLHQK